MFEKYTQTCSRGTREFASHYGRSGNINISAFAVKNHNLSNYSGAVLYFDAGAKKIGIEFTNDQTADGFKHVMHRKNRSVIAGQGFMKYFKLKTFKQRPFTKIKDSFFVIDLGVEER